MDVGKLGKSWNLLFQFFKPGKSWKVIEKQNAF